MKDQKKLLHKCIVDEIPAIVFQGDDSCMVEILKAAKKIYQAKGCSREFLLDFQYLINDAASYQRTNKAKIHLPKLTEVEKELIRQEQIENGL